MLMRRQAQRNNALPLIGDDTRLLAAGLPREN